jgi:hypothetical protein
MKIPIKYLVLIAACILSLFLYLGGVKPRQDAKRLSEALKSLTDTIEYKQAVIDGLKVSVAEKDVTILTTKEALLMEMISKDALKALHFRELKSKTAIIAELTSKLDSISHTGVIIYDTIRIKDTLSIVPSIRLPFTFSHTTTYSSLSGGFSREGVMSATITSQAPLDVYVGLAKKTKDTKVVITSPNPDLKVVYINSLQVVEPSKHWWERQIVGDVLKVGAGVLIGRGTK